MFQNQLKDEAALKLLSAVIGPCPRLVTIAHSLAFITTCLGILAFTTLSLNRFPNKLELNAPNNMLKNQPFCS